jgi:hypothetical protein
MAESKFLQYQDKNGDSLIDVCEEIIDVEETKYCPECRPNPFAMVPSWKELTQDDPYFNGKLCKYQITVVTSYESTNAPENATEEEAEEALQSVFSEYMQTAAESLIKGFSKDGSADSVQAVRSALEKTSYYLDVRPTSRLKLLFSIDYSVIDELDPAPPEPDDNEDEESSDITVVYEPEDFTEKLIQVRKGLKLYNRYLKVFRGLENGNLVFEEGGNIFNLENYGGRNSTLGDTIRDLDRFLNTKGYNIAGIGSRPAFLKDRITKFLLRFDSEYTLKKLKIWTIACGENPTVFKKDQIESLNNSDSFKDKTAMAYLTKLDDMVTDLTAREPKPWIEFLVEHTYPLITETFGYPANQSDPAATVGSCIAGRLEQEAKQLGQDIMDDVFGLADILAWEFNKRLCMEPDENVEFDRRLGFDYDANYRQSEHITKIAAVQAYKQLEEEGDPFGMMCMALAPKGKGEHGGKDLRSVWRDSFEQIKICGLTDMLMDGIKCLFGGLTLEAGLSKILMSAMRALEIDNFEKLFVGLPPEKQEKISNLVAQKIESGNLFASDSNPQQMSDAINGDLESFNVRLKEEAQGKVKWAAPWKNRRLAEDVYGADDDEPEEIDGQRVERTLAQTYDNRKASNQLSPDIVLQAYILAMIEVYKGDLLSLVDHLNKFPGVALITKIIVAADCPGPPQFDPTIMDFIKSIELPFCRSTGDLVIPRLDNPFAWIPELKDLTKALIDAAIEALKDIIVSILFKIMAKLCELLGKAVCKALETVGALAAGLPDLVTGRTTFNDIVKEAICGSDADDEQVEDTIAEMLAALGVGTAALSDQQQVSNFAADVSSATTATELINAFLGGPSSEFLLVVDNLLENKYPDFRDGISNKNDVGAFFKNCGNVFPANFKNDLENFLKNLPDDGLPSNPSICASPEEIEDFCELRTALLVDSGRATPAQALALCDNSDFLNDLGDLSDVLQGLPEYIQKNLPPVISDPGCDNGLLPHDSPAVAAATVAILAGDMEDLKTAFSIDMLGNGPGESRWGMINMIMSDTMGKPLTAHYRKSYNDPSYVDFYTKAEPLFGSDGSALLNVPMQIQRGAFPLYMAEWLQYQLQGDDPIGGNATDLANSLDAGFNSNNDWIDTEYYSMPFENFKFSENIFGVTKVKLIRVPNVEYNTSMFTDYQNEKIVFRRVGRKATPDIALDFRDNGRGFRALYGTSFSEGFRIEMFLSDLEKNGVTGTITNRRSDNMRIMITELKNPDAMVPSIAAHLDIEEGGAEPDGSGDSDSVGEELLYEFVSDDGWYSGLDLNFTQYPNYNVLFEGSEDADEPISEYAPQVVLLSEITGVDTTTAKSFYNEKMQTLFKMLVSDIAGDSDNPNIAFQYGAKYDDLTRAGIDYLVPQGYINEGELYSKGEIEDEDASGGQRKIRNSDAILGISRDMWDNIEAGTPEKTRVFYLDPMEFGGSYKNPPLYIKPMPNKGWLGLIDVLFPDLSPCKPNRTDLVDFEEIEDQVKESYPSIPEDQRLKADPDCVYELPYNRILERASASGIEGLITAACRIYACTHLIKIIPVISKFKPLVSEVFSSAYAAYIVEEMEQSFRDAQGPGSEALNPFKDDEFWFSFLEQVVQMYGRKLDEGTTLEPPQNVLTAMSNLNNFQETYKSMYPMKEPSLSPNAKSPEGPNANSLQVAKDLKQEPRVRSIKTYRYNENLEAVQASSDDAKVVLRHLIVEELNKMGEKLTNNLSLVEMGPEEGEYYSDLADYVLMKLTHGSNLELNKKIKEEIVGLPTKDEPDPGEQGYEYPGPYYSSGGELASSSGEDYVGYYHIHEDTDGAMIYMAGEFHTEEAHDILQPTASKVIVPIGSISDYGTATTYDITKIFMVEKYMSIDGIKYSVSTAMDELSTIASTYSTETMPNISDLYPGSLEQVLDPYGSGQVIGLTGELGIRHGLEFSIMINDQKITLTTVEVDALDYKINNVAPLEDNSKLLLCLVNMLKEDDNFKLFTKYIFPLNKILSTIAIYCDMAFLPSIGEWTVSTGDTIGIDASQDTKPGVFAEITKDGAGKIASIETSGNAGWASAAERQAASIGTLYVREWDDWDKVLLKRTKLKLKRRFKKYYHFRDWSFDGWSKPRPGEIVMKNLRDAMRPKPGERLLPRWKKRRLRDNPYDLNGQLCEKSDE